MTPWDRIFGGAWRGAALGAVTLTLLTLLYYQLFNREPLQDGQFALLLYLFPVPFGATLGAVAGAAKVLLDLRAPQTAGWICIGGGGLITVLAMLYSLVFPGSRSPFALAHPAYGAPLVWAVVVVVWGLVLLGRG